MKNVRLSIFSVKTFKGGKTFQTLMTDYIEPYVHIPVLMTGGILGYTGMMKYYGHAPFFNSKQCMIVMYRELNALTNFDVYLKKILFFCLGENLSVFMDSVCEMFQFVHDDNLC